MPNELRFDDKIIACHQGRHSGTRSMIVELLQKGIGATESQDGKVPKPENCVADSFRVLRTSKQPSTGVAISVVGYLHNDLFRFR